MYSLNRVLISLLLCVSRYAATIPEGSPIGTSALTVLATDADFGQNAVVLYEITGSSFSTSLYAIDNTTGAITSISPLCFDNYEVLTIRAYDMGTPSLDANVTVRIQIVNMNLASPTFTFFQGLSAYEFSVFEDVANGTIVGNVSATDLDCGDNALLTYEMQQGQDTFRVDFSTGTISTIAPLDFEAQASYVYVSNILCYWFLRWSVFIRYTVAVSASDNFPRGPRIAVAFVTITVLDRNDNSPTFSQATYATTLLESNVTNRAVVNVLATDPDSGLFGIVRYSLEVSDGSSLFSVDEVRYACFTCANCAAEDFCCL